MSGSGSDTSTYGRRKDWSCFATRSSWRAARALRDNNASRCSERRSRPANATSAPSSSSSRRGKAQKRRSTPRCSRPRAKLKALRERHGAPSNELHFNSIKFDAFEFRPPRVSAHNWQRPSKRARADDLAGAEGRVGVFCEQLHQMPQRRQRTAEHVLSLPAVGELAVAIERNFK